MISWSTKGNAAGNIENISSKTIKWNEKEINKKTINKIIYRKYNSIKYSKIKSTKIK